MVGAYEIWRPKIDLCHNWIDNGYEVSTWFDKIGHLLSPVLTTGWVNSHKEAKHSGM